MIVIIVELMVVNIVKDISASTYHEAVLDWPTTWPSTNMMDNNDATCDTILGTEDSTVAVLVSTPYNYSTGVKTEMQVIGHNLPCGDISMVVSGYSYCHGQGRLFYECSVMTIMQSGPFIHCDISCTCGGNICDMVFIKIHRPAWDSPPDVIEICTIS